MNGKKSRRYRRPKVIAGQIKMQRGRIGSDDPDICIFYGDDVPRCDRALVMNTMCSPRWSYENKSMPSFLDELEARGYDIETFKFSIERLEL